MGKTIFLVLIAMIFNLLSEQSMNGKWILKDIDSGNGKKGYPGFQMLKIKDSMAEFYRDFTLKKKSDLKVWEGQILTTKNSKFAKFKVIDENHLKLFLDGKSNGKDTVFECDFYRLEPTITTLKKEDIEKLTFILIENESETELIFNKELWNKEHLELSKRKEGEKRVIEQIDSTFFVSMYWDGKRNGSIPIKEVSTELLKLYAIPTGPM